MSLAVTQLGSNAVASGTTTLVLTTSAAAPAGCTILVLAADSGSTAFSSITDSAGNTYSAGAVFSNGTGKQRFYWVQNAALLASGGTITVTYGGTGSAKLMAAIAITGAAALNLQGAGTSGTSTTPSQTTATLGWPNEIAIGSCQVSSGSADSYTEAPGFTSNTSALLTDGLHWGYEIVASTAAVTYAPTLGTSRTWGVNTITFSGALASPFNQASRFGYLEM